MYNLGGLLREQGEAEEAEEWFGKAVAAGDTAAMVNLGVLLREQGRDGEAEEWYRKAAAAGLRGRAWRSLLAVVPGVAYARCGARCSARCRGGIRRGSWA